jgi:hypothetical protein
MRNQDRGAVVERQTSRAIMPHPIGQGNQTLKEKSRKAANFPANNHSQHTHQEKNIEAPFAVSLDDFRSPLVPLRIKAENRSQAELNLNVSEENV